jgi:hypothetical protein
MRSTGWRGRLLGTTSCHNLAYHGGQDGVGMIPADQVEALEGLVCEIKRMSPSARGTRDTLVLIVGVWPVPKTHA